jgi:hypothetical protein
MRKMRIRYRVAGGAARALWNKLWRHARGTRRVWVLQLNAEPRGAPAFSRPRLEGGRVVDGLVDSPAA